MSQKRLGVILLAVLAAGVALSSAASATSCAACDRFLPQISQLAAHHSGLDASDSDLELQLCHGVDGEFIGACGDVVETYGLENIQVLLQRAPNFICEHLESCRAKGITLDEKLGLSGSLLDNAGDLLVQDLSNDMNLGLISTLGAQAGAPAGGSGEPSANVAIGGLSAIGQGLNQLNQQAMLQQAEQEEILRRATEKLRRAEARNRGLKRDMRRLRKDTWRAQPGNCDCCDACLPPS